MRTYAIEIVEALFDIAMKVTVNSFRNLGLGIRIPNIEEVSGGRVLKLTGLTSEGKTVKRR